MISLIIAHVLSNMVHTLDVSLGLSKNFCLLQTEKHWLVSTIQMKVSKDIAVRHPAHITFEYGDFQLIQNNATPWMKRTRCYLIQIHAPQMYKNVNSPLKKDFTQLCFHGWSRKLPLKMEASLLLYTASSTKLQIIIIVKILQSGVCSMYLLSSLLA